MKRLSQNDYKAILEYTNKNYYIYLKVLSNLNNGTISSSNNAKQIYYGTYENNQLINLVMHNEFDNHLRIFGDKFSDEDLKFLDELVQKKDYDYLTYPLNQKEVLSPILEKIKVGYVYVTVLAIDSKKIVNPNLNFKVEIATIDDVDQLRQLARTIFGRNSQIISKKQWINDLKTGQRISYVIKKDNEIVSMATVSDFTNKSAVIGKIGTLRKYRNLNLIDAIIYQATSDLSLKNLNPTILADNPFLIPNYHQLGFKDIDYFMFGKVKKVK